MGWRRLAVTLQKHAAHVRELDYQGTVFFSLFFLAVARSWWSS